MARLSSRKRALSDATKAQAFHHSAKAGQQLTRPLVVQGRFTAKQLEQMWLAFWDSQKGERA